MARAVPSFAQEVAAGLPTAVTIAAIQQAFADQLAQIMHSPRFRTYTTNDIISVQVGGAVKNVLAIAAGIADGLGSFAAEMPSTSWPISWIACSLFFP
jgi:glycerol-3-phosphate dehydrogenase (NAD(P)+)